MRRGVPYQEILTTRLSTDDTLTSAAAARTPSSSTGSSAWRWQFFPQNIYFFTLFTFQAENVACGGAIAARGVCPECSQMKSTCTKSIVIRCLFLFSNSNFTFHFLERLSKTSINQKDSVRYDILNTATRFDGHVVRLRQRKEVRIFK